MHLNAINVFLHLLLLVICSEVSKESWGKLLALAKTTKYYWFLRIAIWSTELVYGLEFVVGISGQVEFFKLGLRKTSFKSTGTDFALQVTGAKIY